MCIKLPVLFFVVLSALTSQTPVAFVDVTVIPMDRERVLAHQTVVVSEGRVTAVGPAARVRVPVGAMRIDGRGRYLMPGLADMHIHCTAPTIEETDQRGFLYVANGITTARCMWGTDAALAFRHRIETRKAVGPRLFVTGAVTDGEPSIWPNSRVVVSPEAARRAVRDDIAAGFDAFKVYNNLSEPIYEAIIEESRNRGFPVYGHVPDAVGLAKVLSSGQSSIEHLEGYFEAAQRPGSAHANTHVFVPIARLMENVDPTQLPALVKATRKVGVWNCPTLVTTDAARSLDIPALAANAAMDYVQPALRMRWDDMIAARQRRRSPADIELGRRAAEFGYVVVRALHKGGARILLGTDAPNPYVVPGFSIHQELLNLTKAGLTPFEALRAGTSGAAAFLNRGSDFGIVATGRRADLILLTADPLLDVRNVQRRAGVLLNGRWFAEEELQSGLDRIATIYRGMR